MSISETGPSRPERVIGLPTSMDITFAESLRQECFATLELGCALRMDAADVTRITTPCIQVLLSASKSFRDAGMPFALDDPSDVFLETLDLLNLSQVLLDRKFEK